MSNYVKAVDYASKDSLLSGDPGKIIRGTEIDTEYNAISVAVSTKADLVSPTFTGTVAAAAATITNLTTSNATITGGSVTGITDLAVADGGTGASSITANSVILGNGSSTLSGNLVAPSTTGNILTSDGTTWTSAAPAVGGQYLGTAAIKAIAYNAQTIGENITISSTQNGLSSGPITINSGFTVTISSGGNWAIV
jgi:hypothetical protein